MKNRNRLISNITPILIQLDSEWFEPSEKSPEGYNYSCGHCDMFCGGNESHDPDCFLDQAKKAIIEFRKIDLNPKYETNFIEEVYSKEEILEVCNWSKTNYLIRAFFPAILHLLGPFDYEDPENQHVVCSCYYGSNQRQHTADCPVVNLSRILAEYIS